MKYKATVCFGGSVSMAQGEVREINNPNIVKDLLKAGYIVECKPADKGNAKTNKDKKGAKANEE